MRQAHETLAFKTRHSGLVEITAEVAGFLKRHQIATGLLTLFCRHTSASLLIQENAAPEVRADLEAYFERIAPEAPGRYAHHDEGPDDMPSHLRTALTQTSLQVPVIGGRMALGAWQGLYLFEHRAAPHTREVVAHIIGD